MILTIPGWSGRFDIEIDYRRGWPGDGYFQPPDPDQLDIELIVWEFSPHDCIVVAPPTVDCGLYHALERAAWDEVAKDPYSFCADDSEFFDMQGAP